MAKILIIRLSSFGDVAMLIPVVHSVAARYPQDRFTILTRTAYANLFENLGFNVNVIHFNPKKYNGLIGLLKLLSRLNRGTFSHIADMHDVLRSKIIRYNLWLKVDKVRVIDKERNKRDRAILDKKLGNLTPTMDRYFDVFNRLGFPAELSFSNLFEFSERSFHLLEPFVSAKEGQLDWHSPICKT